MARSFTLLAFLLSVGVSLTFGQTWRARGASERFDTDDVKTLNGTITNVSHPYATFKADDGKEYQVHMGPYWFWERHEYALKKNIKATIKGEVENVKGTLHIYPWEVMQDGKTMTLADDDGVPEWVGRRGGRGIGKGNSYGPGRGYRGNGVGRCCCGRW